MGVRVGLGGGSGGGCGYMWYRLVCMHAHAISPACMLVVCSRVLTRCLHTAWWSTVLVAMAGRWLSRCAGGVGWVWG